MRESGSGRGEYALGVQLREPLNPGRAGREMIVGSGSSHCEGGAGGGVVVVVCMVIEVEEAAEEEDEDDGA